MTLPVKPSPGQDSLSDGVSMLRSFTFKPVREMLNNRNSGICLIALFALTALAGCYQQAGTRYPTLGYRPPYVERKSYELHDPFPAEDMGPDTFSRPRGFTDQRTSPRRAKEAQVLQGLNSDYIPSQPPPPATGPNGYGYPNVVGPQ